MLTQKQKLRQLVQRLWPAGLFWLLLMFADYCAAHALTHGNLPMQMFPALLGFFFAQFFLVVMLGGLVGRTWTTGWLLAVLLTTVAILICQLGTLSSIQTFQGEGYAIIAFVPVLMLAACAPFMAMRVLRGWTLTLDQQSAVERQKASVEDLLLLSVVVAGSVSLIRVVSEFSPGFSQTGQGVTLLAFFAGFSLLCGLPATWITFRARRWSLRLLGWSILAVTVVALCMILNWLINPNFGNDQPGALRDISLSVASCAVTVAAGASVLLASSLRLTHFAKVGERAEDEAEADKAVARIRHARRQTRLVAGGMLLLALMVSVGLTLADLRRKKFLESVQAFGKQGPELGSSIAIKENKIVSLVVSPQTTDATFSRYWNMRDLERISLAHSQVTDAVAAQLTRYPKLSALDLSDTAFSDAGLRNLVNTVRPNELALAKTKVSFRQSIEAAKSMGVGKLDLSEMDISDEQLFEQLSEPQAIYSINSLTLRGNPITDKGLAHLLGSLLNLVELDVSNTQIDGSGIVASRCPPTLILDNTKITDANLIAILNKNPSINVSLKNTAITAQVLRHVVNAQTSLALGGGKISESDLAKLGQVGIPHLRLNGPEFTGMSVGDAGIQVQSLDLSHSNATDASVAKICHSGQSYVWKLVLAHTRVTDAVLPALQTLNVYDLDLRHTNITAQGLLHSQLNCGRIIVSHDQFAPAELTLLGQRYRLAIDEETPWPGP